jgi:hypothetical protein
MTAKLKDKDAVLDFCFDWKPLTNGVTGAKSDWLQAGEAITAYTVTVPTGLTKGAVTQSGGKVTVWLSGGTAGTYYPVMCSITTDGGRTDNRTMVIYVTER